MEKGFAAVVTLGLVCGPSSFGAITNEYITVADEYLEVSPALAPAGTTANKNALGLLFQGDRTTGGSRVPIIQFDTGRTWLRQYIVSAELLFHAGGRTGVPARMESR